MEPRRKRRRIVVESDSGASGDEYKPESAAESSDDGASSGVAESEAESQSEPETPLKTVSWLP